MSENYYMYGYREETAEEYKDRETIYNLENKIEDLEFEIERLKDELSHAIPIEWIEKEIEETYTDPSQIYALESIVEDWRKENER